MTDPRRELYRLAYSEVTRAIEIQNADLNDLRSRAAHILTMGSVATGFLLSAAVEARLADYLVVVGLGLFLLLAGLVASVLLPRWKFQDAMRGDEVIEWVGSESGDIEATALRDLAIKLQSARETNRATISAIRKLLSLAILSLILEVGWFVLSVALGFAVEGS